MIGGLINFLVIAFPLPLETVKEVNKLLAKFLWGSKDQSRPMHKVKWEECCKSLDEGGLGINSVDLKAKVAAFRNVWHLLSGVENIWTIWAKQNLLRNCSFW